MNRTQPVAALAIAAAALLTLSACGPSAADRAASSSPDPSSSTTGFPVQVKSCTEELTFDKAPERVLMLSGTGAPNLDALGLLDKVVARAGEKNFGDQALQAKVDAIPKLASSEHETGGAVVTTEAVLEVRPDLVIGFDSGVDREQLRVAGVPLYSPDAFCKNYSVQTATWDLVDSELTKLAQIFGVTAELPAITKQLDEQVSGLKPANVQAGANAAALYVTPGSSTFYAYGSSSMVQPIFASNGLENSYADQTTRVFDASMEDLLKRNPDWIVLLAADATDEEAMATFRGFNGTAELKAVTNNHVLVLPFALTDPPTTSSVKGAVELSKLIEAK